MDVKEIIDINTIKTDLDLENKDEALREVAELLLENNYITDVDGFLNDIYAREAAGKTGIGNHIAIPHGNSEFVKKIGVAIGITRKDIPWETLDGRGVKLIILFAVGKNNDGAQSHLKLLSSFARKLGNEEVTAKLLQAENPESVKAVLTS